VVRASIAGLVVSLAAIATVALAIQHHVVSEASRADAASRLATAYQDARFWVGQDESLERKYRLEPSQAVLDLHEQAGDNLIADLHRVAALDRSRPARETVARLLRLHGEYEEATARMFAATRAGDTPLVKYLDHVVTDPIFSVIQADVYGGATSATASALKQSAGLQSDEAGAFRAGLLSVVLAFALVGAMSLAIRRYRLTGRRLRRAELQRLSEMVITDPLTGLRNHRAFHEELQSEIRRAGRTGMPLALVLLDVDRLKELNDTLGHQVGDEQLRALADAIASTMRAGERAYRIGGDEFAVVLPAVGQWAGFQFAQRLQAALKHAEGTRVQVSAGISQATEPRSKDEVIREADRALVSAKRSGQATALYTRDMGDFARSALVEADDHHLHILANALALAVDAKDSYTQSHSQTVSNLCAVIGGELGLDGERLKRLRLAGLLHDVGKIGIPDAILKKPSKLDPAEYAQMKTHSVLGEGIVLAAEMPERARWVRHHHERIDGAGYPDGLAGSEIPLESRIIHVADAFEAMTADRPYRKAPGVRFAVEQLRSQAGTQFDRDVVNALMRVLGERPADGPPPAQAAVGAATGARVVANA
jgi:diguanylate cyclase (GGDEF)-like protein